MSGPLTSTSTATVGFTRSVRDEFEVRSWKFGCSIRAVILLRLLRVAFAIAGAMLIGSQLPTADAARVQSSAPPIAWRQWGGPYRNFTVPNAGLVDSWPEGGPRMVWSRPLGPGHSS